MSHREFFILDPVSTRTGVCCTPFYLFITWTIDSLKGDVEPEKVTLQETDVVRGSRREWSWSWDQTDWGVDGYGPVLTGSDGTKGLDYEGCHGSTRPYLDSCPGQGSFVVPRSRWPVTSPGTDWGVYASRTLPSTHWGSVDRFQCYRQTELLSGTF